MAAPGAVINPSNPYRSIAGPTWAGGTPTNAIARLSGGVGSVPPPAPAMPGLGGRVISRPLGQPQQGGGGGGGGFVGGGNSQAGWTGARDANGRPVMASAGAHGMGGGFTPPAPNINPGMGGVGDLYSLQNDKYIDPVSGQVATRGTADHSIFNDPGYKAMQAHLADAPNAAGHSWNTTPQGAAIPPPAPPNNHSVSGPDVSQIDQNTPFAAYGGSGMRQAVVGDPQADGLPNPEVVTSASPIHVVPLKGPYPSGMPRYAEGDNPPPAPTTGGDISAPSMIEGVSPDGQTSPQVYAAPTQLDGVGSGVAKTFGAMVGGVGGNINPPPAPVRAAKPPDVDSSPLDIYRMAAGTIDPNTGENLLSPGNPVAHPDAAVSRLNSLPFAQRAAIQQSMATPQGRGLLQQQEMSIVGQQNKNALEAWKENQSTQRWADREKATGDRAANALAETKDMHQTMKDHMDRVDTQRESYQKAMVANADFKTRAKAADDLQKLEEKERTYGDLFGIVKSRYDQERAKGSKADPEKISLLNAIGKSETPEGMQKGLNFYHENYPAEKSLTPPKFYTDPATGTSFAQGEHVQRSGGPATPHYSPLGKDDQTGLPTHRFNHATGEMEIISKPGSGKSITERAAQVQKNLPPRTYEDGSGDTGNY